AGVAERSGRRLDGLAGAEQRGVVGVGRDERRRLDERPGRGGEAEPGLGDPLGEVGGRGLVGGGGGGGHRYRPRKTGGRFSATARGPSFASSLANASQPIGSWWAIASASDRCSVSRQARRMALIDSGPQAAICWAMAIAVLSAWPSGTTRLMRPISFAS